MGLRKWHTQNLKSVVKKSTSYRGVIQKLGLIPAGGNYVHIQRRIKEMKIDVSHFRGKGWSKGMIIERKPVISLEEILVRNSYYQSFKLKRRLFKEGLKQPRCEECGWAKKAIDGRLPLELDHVNGNRLDNRLENLRVLCPNCHSLKSTHRGRNIARVAERYTHSA